MTILENYLREARDARATGEAVRETSFYPALSNLLNGVGAALRPKVRAVINLKNRGAGLPDGGLFAARQLRKSGGDEALRDPSAFGGRQPERGVVEVKAPCEDVRAVAASAQVTRYLRHYGQVLVTNLREFLLVGSDASGAVKLLEGYALAETEAEFWRGAARPREFAAAHGARLEEYLKRVMLRPAPLEAPESLAWFLASYARDARERVEREPAALQSLASVREALGQALGLKFEGEQGEQFFRSTLVQTLFYGVFSAWVLWAKGGGGGRRFDWRMAAWTLHVPAIRTLFEQVVTPSNVRGLGLEEVLDWTAETLSRVRAAKFFERFRSGHAVQYFYEPFLEAFDPGLRKQLGVWYTPEEVVRYMVERTDRVLREELGVEAGLADERVYVLDPCCGTGAYLVEVLRRIRQTIDERGGDALAAHDLKRAATRRVFGFEILPAPFVVAHLQLGLLLQAEGAPLAEGERVGVYLTNALTGWEPPAGAEGQLPLAFRALAEERDAAEQVKRETPVLVVIGNPPYNAFAGTSAEEEGGLVEVYKEGLVKGWGLRKFNLDDLYVRFFRLAERRVAERTGRGVVCFISNFSYLGDPSFVVMRQRFLAEFDKLWFDSLNGDSRETGKLTPEGRPDPSVFSTPYNREGIRVGTAVGLLVRGAERARPPQVLTREFWGATKRQDLLDSLDDADFDARYTPAHPDATNRHSFRPRNVGADYLRWPALSELSAVSPVPGMAEDRKKSLIKIDRDSLEGLMRDYFDRSLGWEEFESRHAGGGLTLDASRFVAREARAKLLAREEFDPGRIVRFNHHPFDVRWAYVSYVRPLWSEPIPSMQPHFWEGNLFFVTRMNSQASPEGAPCFLTRDLFDRQFTNRNPQAFPLFLNAATKRDDDRQSALPGHGPEEAAAANLSPRARAYLAALGVADVDGDRDAAALVWYHALAVCYSPAYLSENADAVRTDFPRVPLPATRGSLEESAALGRRVAALLDTRRDVPGVTSGAVGPVLRAVAALRRADGEAPLDPSAGDLELRAGWGHRGAGGVVMPGRGRAQGRDYTDAERARLGEAAGRLGPNTYDVYLNDAARWSNVPRRVWDYTVGGHQVVKKWLSYRERELLGRSLTPEEAREVTQTARRLAALVLLEPDLDANYARVRSACRPW